MANKIIAGTATGATALPVAATIDATADYLAIYTANVTATQAITRNTLLGITGSPVGTSDTQALSNKTIGITNTITALDTLFTLEDNGDNTKKLQFQLSGITTGTTRTLTVPDISDTLTTLTATQTLTNKTLTSPTINSPTITNATITTDSVAGYSASTTGTIYGISVSSGVITTTTALGTGTVPTAALQASSVTYAKLAAGTTELGFNNNAGGTLTTSYVTYATVTATSHGGKCEVQFSITGGNANSGGDKTFTVQVTCDGSAITPSSITYDSPYQSGITTTLSYSYIMSSTPAAGSHTWNLQLLASAGSAVTVGNNYMKIMEVA